MRAALAALAEQQKLIDALTAKSAKQEVQIAQLTRGLSAVSKLTGNDIPVRTAIFKRADEQNPAQPVPEPAPEAPTESTVEAETPEAFADVRAPGLVPGSNNDTAADAVSTAYTPGLDIPSPAVNELTDVTRPIDGTQGRRPLEETKTQVDVRVGDPMHAQVAFPVNGPFADAQRTSARTFASLKLARLRIATGTAESGVDDLVLADSIAKDASLDDSSIDREIETLERVRTASAKSKGDDAPRNLVPRPAGGVQRTVPTLTSTASRTSGDDDVADLFLGDL